MLLLLSLANLVIGTGAFVLGGILAPISADLGVSVPAAGQAMTAYALSTAVLAPLLLAFTGKLPRRHAMVLALFLFAIGNFVCAAAASLAMLLAGRVLMGIGAMFTPIAAGLAVATAAPAQRGRALSIVFLGISLSYVVGLPLGTWLATQHNWRLPVQGVGAASLLMLALLLWRLPATANVQGAGFKGIGALLRRPDVVLTLALTLLYFTAIFTLFAYIGPVLQALGPMSVSAVALTLVAVGLAGVAGTLAGGWATDRFGAQTTLKWQLAVFLLCQAALPLTAGRPLFTIGTLVVWGVSGFGMMPPQQSRLAAAAPASAPLLLSLNTSMLYLGTALGSVVGGAASAPLGFGSVAWAGLPFLALGVLTLFRRD
jgi:DHA1 family inner membrane transport protein